MIGGLMALFRGEARRRLDALSSSAERVAAGDPAERMAHLRTLRDTAHALKGSALTVGLAQAAAAAGEVERLAAVSLAGGGDPAPGRLEALLAELESACEGVSDDDGDVAAVAPPRTAERTRTVVCVEDDPASAILLERVLAQRPWIETKTATCARAGIELARAAPPDLMLVDLHLPDGTGEDVVIGVRASEATARVPVVIVSADAVEDTATRLRAAGADRYLTKPLDLGELLAVVDEYAGPRRS